MPADHVDDDVISDAIDGVAPDAPAAEHLASCPSCQARLARITEASRLVAAPVPPLDPSAVDAVVERAMAAPVIPIDELKERRRLLRTMPPPWLVAVAAAAALVVGIPALLQSTDERQLVGKAVDTGSSALSESASAGGAASDVSSGASAGDYLGAFDSDEAVTASLRARLDTVQSEPQLVARPAADAAAEARSSASDSKSAPGSAVTADASVSAFQGSSGPPAPTCKAEAKAAANATSGGAEPIYLAPATWQGKGAMVFVFTVAQPAGDGLRRQAYVMAVPGCAVAAAPRF